MNEKATVLERQLNAIGKAITEQIPGSVFEVKNLKYIHVKKGEKTLELHLIIRNPSNVGTKHAMFYVLR